MVKHATIDLAMIVKDDKEALQLDRCLETIAPFVRSIYITHTGKEVKQVEAICKRYKANISHFDWVDDFSQARNYNFSQVAGNPDYILWLDADDLFSGGEYLEVVADSAMEKQIDNVLFDYWYVVDYKDPTEPSLETIDKVQVWQTKDRLIRPGTHKWVNRLHEAPVPIITSPKAMRIKYTKDIPVAVVHTATMENGIVKMERNRRLLELQLEDEKQAGSVDPRTLLNIMKIYNELPEPELWRKAIEMGEEYIVKSGWDEERAVAHEIMGICSSRLGANEKGLSHFFQAINEYPGNPIYALRIAQAYYNMNMLDKSYRWLQYGLQTDVQKGGTIVNYGALQEMVLSLTYRLAVNLKGDYKEAYTALEQINKLYPSKENEELLHHTEDVMELNEACKHVNGLMEYFDKTGTDGKKVLDALPEAITSQPFARNWIKTFTKPRVWGDKEICYFANFGASHFEKWDESSLVSGIGGSETAVIRLAQEWVKMGYKVTVYGDPKLKGERDGITWLPFYYFNADDTFSTFIQWRGYQLAGQINCKKFLVDLHDIYNLTGIKKEQLDNITYFMVKSKYHRGLAPEIPDNKFKIIGNGIDL